MADRDYKAFIVEGEVREPQVIDNISKVFINVFAMRLSCLFGLSKTMEYEQYTDEVSPGVIHELEKKEAKNCILQDGSNVGEVRSTGDSPLTLVAGWRMMGEAKEGMRN